MGAGVIECDVTFTKDLELVCRHAQNDLHTTTNILLTPLATKCTTPFTPATFGADGRMTAPATAECRTSDLTLAEFRTLRGKMDALNPAARTAEEFQGGTEGFRTGLHAGPTSGHLMTHRESIELFKTLGVKMTPELKVPVVPMPLQGRHSNVSRRSRSMTTRPPAWRQAECSRNPSVRRTCSIG